MILYHGSNVVVEEPRIIQPDRRLDFGSGFYLTSSKEQAQRWAELTTLRRGSGQELVSEFEIDGSVFSNLRVLKFDSASVEWLKYVNNNRNVPTFTDDFDVVIGPVANDRTMPVLRLYFAGAYTEEEAIRRLLPQKLKDQYAFRSNIAIEALRFKGVDEL